MRVRLKHDKLAELIAASSLTQNHWALKLGLSRGHWSGLVNGKHPFPSAKTRALILESFNVPLETLFDIDPADDAWADLDFRRAIADRYLIDSEVGQGGMGAVYLARDVRHGRLVAIKVIASEAISGIGLTQFRREISTVAQLLHPNIVPLYESGDIAGQPFFVMPYIRTGSLRALLTRETRLPVPETLRLIKGIAAALSHAHAERVLHCDVKPENILLLGEHVWVTDFGIAKRLRSESESWLQRKGIDISAGTPAYVSPEQASGEEPLDARSDVYSLGCVTFEMLSGRPPFQGSNTQQIVSRRFLAPPPDVRTLAPDVPAEVAEVVARAMALRRDDRPASAAEFARELENAATRSTSAAARARYALWRGVAATQRTLHLTSRDRLGRSMRNIVGAFVQDVRFGARMLAKHPVFTIVAVLTLALGIGANTAVFSVINAVLLRPLPFQEPNRIVALGQTSESNREDLAQFSFRNFADLRERATSFDRLAAYYNNSLTLTGEGEAVRLRGAVVTADLFPLLGAAPALGRTFVSRDEAAGGGQDGYPAILSWKMWQTRFNSDSTVVGRPINLSGNTYTVVGVMPATFAFPVQAQSSDIWITPARDAEQTGEGAIMVSRGYHGWRAVARLKAGASMERAQAEASAIATSLATQFPDANKALGVRIMPLRDWLVGNARTTLFLLLGTVALVLVIACSNVAHLLLERGVTRQREMRVRLALGASRWRIARQLFTEMLMLSTVAGVLGVGLAIFGTRMLVSLSPGSIARFTEASIDTRVLLFTVIVSLGTGIVFGVLPALGVSRVKLAASLQEGGRGGSTGLRSGRAHNLLIVAEVALSLVMLIGAGLLVRTLWELQNVPLGFDPRNILTMTVAKSPDKGSMEPGEFFRQLTERVRGLPGVVNASVTWQLPLSGAGASTGVGIEGQPEDGPNVRMGVLHSASPGYFSTMGIPIVRGRDFTDHDDLKSAPVIIVNEELARKFFPGEDAIGKHIRPGFSTNDNYVMREIIGVVGNVKHSGLRSGVTPEFYFAQAQMPLTTLTLVVRSSGDPRALVTPVRNVVQSMDANAPVFAVTSGEEYLSRSVASTRFNMTLIAAFAVLALVMTAVGLYGVISFAVTQATREIGIRVALGAQSRDTLGVVVGKGLRLTIAGVVIGLIAAYALTRLMASLLFGVGATDPVTFASVAFLLIAVATVACYIPARRATAVDPMVALRYE